MAPDSSTRMMILLVSFTRGRHRDSRPARQPPHGKPRSAQSAESLGNAVPHDTRRVPLAGETEQHHAIEATAIDCSTLSAWVLLLRRFVLCQLVPKRLLEHNKVVSSDRLGVARHQLLPVDSRDGCRVDHCSQSCHTVFHVAGAESLSLSSAKMQGY